MEEPPEQEPEMEELHWRDVPSQIGCIPTGCISIVLFVLLLLAVDPIFVGYGFIILGIKIAEWIIKL